AGKAADERARSRSPRPARAKADDDLASEHPTTGPRRPAGSSNGAPGTRLIFSERFACPVSGFAIPEIEPRLFSFNNPFGACPACGGLGVEQKIDPDLVIPDKDKSLERGAIAPWARSTSPYYTQTLQALGRHFKFALTTAWKNLPAKVRDVILYGS